MREPSQIRAEAAPIKCAGRESAGRPIDSHIESAGRPTDSLIESVGKPADSLPSHFIGVASGQRLANYLHFSFGIPRIFREEAACLRDARAPQEM